jgi:hypothetical protein
MKHIPDINTCKLTLCGPSGISACLDSSQIYIDDPGMGTPILLAFKGEYMTWGCAYEGGNWIDVIGSVLRAQFEIEAHQEVHQAWLEEIAPEVEAWEAHHHHKKKIK